MPKKNDEGELGNAPTAITAVVPEQRNREPTQQIPVPDVAEADPAWASSTLSGAEDPTTHSAVTPRSTFGDKLKMSWRSAIHEFQKLPARTRTLIIVAGSVFVGGLFGLLMSPSPKVARPEEELQAFAKRLQLPEKDQVRRALSLNDTTAALMELRAMNAKDHVAADPVGLALRGRLALLARDPVDALDQLEAAITAQPKLMDEPWFAPAVVQTFLANKPGRTTTLLGRVARPVAVEALQKGCADFSRLVRHGSADALKTLSGACPDPIGSLILDAYQVDKCDAARAVLTDLVPQANNDDRVAGALDAMSRRPSIAKCVADLIPHK